MKYKRKKQAKRVLQLLRTTFNFHEPFQILIDGTFCQSALEHKINIREQLSNYLSASVKLFTTKCALKEIDFLGEPFRGGLHILKQYKCLKCSHETVNGIADCFLSLIGEENRKRYMLATLDRDLRSRGRSVPGTPILTLANNTLVLEAPSTQTKLRTQQIESSKLLPSAGTKSTIRGLKAQLPMNEIGVKKRGRKVRKGPNPLSRISSKKNTNLVENRNEVSVRSKQRRKRKMKQKARTVLNNLDSSKECT